MSKGCIIAIVVVVILVVLVLGCIGFAIMKGMRVKPQAEAVATQYFEAIRVKDYNKASSMYDQQFFQKVPKTEWIATLKGVNRKLGDLTSYQQVNWNMNAQATTGATPGVYVTLTYKVTYTKYPADETLTLFMPAGGTTFTIAGHQINSSGLLK